MGRYVAYNPTHSGRRGKCSRRGINCQHLTLPKHLQKSMAEVDEAPLTLEDETPEVVNQTITSEPPQSQKSADTPAAAKFVPDGPQEKKAQGYMDEADKKVKSSQSFLGGLFGWGWIRLIRLANVLLRVLVGLVLLFFFLVPLCSQLSC